MSIPIACSTALRNARSKLQLQGQELQVCQTKRAVRTHLFLVEHVSRKLVQFGWGMLIDQVQVPFGSSNAIQTPTPNITDDTKIGSSNTEYCISTEQIEYEHCAFLSKNKKRRANQAYWPHWANTLHWRQFASISFWYLLFVLDEVLPTQHHEMSFVHGTRCWNNWTILDSRPKENKDLCVTAKKLCPDISFRRNCILFFIVRIRSLLSKKNLSPVSLVWNTGLDRGNFIAL